MTAARQPRQSQRTPRSTASASVAARRDQVQRQPRKTQSKATRPELQVHHQVRVSPRIRAFGLITFVFAVLFASLFFQSQLVAGQKHLDEINNGIRHEIALERELRQAQAEAQAPHHIMAQAEDMGLVKAESAIPLLPPGVGK